MGIPQPSRNDFTNSLRSRWWLAMWSSHGTPWCIHGLWVLWVAWISFFLCWNFSVLVRISPLVLLSPWESSNFINEQIDEHNQQMNQHHPTSHSHPQFTNQSAIQAIRAEPWPGRSHQPRQRCSEETQETARFGIVAFLTAPCGGDDGPVAWETSRF